MSNLVRTAGKTARCICKSKYICTKILNTQTHQYTITRPISGSAMTRGKVLTMGNINPAVKDVEYAVRGPIVQRASEIEEELEKGVPHPFKEVVKANIGDCHAMGQKPITFIRQLVAACACPELIEHNVFPDDVNSRAKTILSKIRGSIGCYSESQGISLFRESCANYITNRDGYPASPNDIFITNGASSSVKLILELFMSDKEKTGVMIPIPQYPLYSATVSEFSMHQIGYCLDEDNKWGLDIKELKRSLEESKKVCNPRVLCVINPGNPTGQVLSYQNIKEIIEFAMREGLYLLADEVYQDNIWGEDSQFHSFKKVLCDMGSKSEGFEMASFHSTSKGFMGECGLRGGYVEVLGLEQEVMDQLQKLQSAQLGSNVTGQIVLDSVVNPPKKKGESSYELFMKEKSEVLDSLKLRSKMVHEILNSIEGVTCNELMGAMYAFPRIHLPPKAIEKAQAAGQVPDFYYCLRLLEESGLCVVPGSGFCQKEGTYHFRMTILPPVEQLKSFLERFKIFHLKFIAEHS